MKRLLILAMLLLSASTVSAQTVTYTTVTGTVTDTFSTPYANGTVLVKFVDVPNQQSVLGSGPGSTIFQRTYTVPMDTGGNFTVTVPANSSFSPTGTQWSFTVSALGGYGVATVNLTISGSSQNVSSNLSGLARISWPALSNPPPGGSGQYISSIGNGLNAWGISGGTTPSANNIILSSKCGSSVNCFTANGTTRHTGDGVTDGSTGAISSATANFTVLDNNKHIFVTNVASGQQVLCITGTFMYLTSTSGLVSNNSTSVCPGTGNNSFLVIGFKDTVAAQNAFQASIASNLAFNGPPNALIVDCGGYLVDAPPFIANANSYQHNVTFSILGWYPNCVQWYLSDDYNFTGCTTSLGCFYRVTNGVEKSLPPDWLQQSGFGVFRDMAILGPGLLWSSTNGVTWFNVLREVRNVQLANLPGPTATQGSIFHMDYYTSGIYNSDIEPVATQGSNTPYAVDINCHSCYVQNNSFYNSIGTYVRLESGFYADRIRDNEIIIPGASNQPAINVINNINSMITGNFFSHLGASNIGIQIDGTSRADVSDNVVSTSNAAATWLKVLSGGQSRMSLNYIQGTGIPVNNAGTLVNVGGNQGLTAGAETTTLLGTITSSQTHAANTCNVTITFAADTLCNQFLDQATQVLRIKASSNSTTTCATAPVVTLADGSGTTATLTLTSGAATWDSGALTTLFATLGTGAYDSTHATLTVSVSAGSCASPPTNLAVTYTYQTFASL